MTAASLISVTHRCWFLYQAGCWLLSFLLLILLFLLVTVRALHLGNDLGVGLCVLYPLENNSTSISLSLDLFREGCPVDRCENSAYHGLVVEGEAL